MANDILKNSADAFNNLLHIEYLIEIGRKGKNVFYKLVFHEVDFKHLAGIQYLEDSPFSKMAADKVFIKSCDCEISEEDLALSSHFLKIKDRLENLRNLEKYLDSNMNVFKWDKTKSKISKIQADYMFKEKVASSSKGYVFLKEKHSLLGNELEVSEIKNEHAITFFSSTADYSKNQVPYTLVKNEKVNLNTGIKVTLYDFEVEKNKNKDKKVLSR